MEQTVGLQQEIRERTANSIIIEQPVPFLRYYDHSERIDLPLSLVKARLAAEFSANIDNPYFKPPDTSDIKNGSVPKMFLMFGPYYLATGMTPLEVANDITEKSKEFLERLDAETGNDGIVGRLMDILRFEHTASRGYQAREDYNLLAKVDHFMGEMTYLRTGPDYDEAANYQTNTRSLVDKLVKTYKINSSRDGNARESFSLIEFFRSNPGQTITLGMDHFRSFAERRAVEFASLAAEKVGHPFVRSAVLPGFSY